MKELNLSDLTDNFKKAIIIDIERKEVYVIKDGKLKVYPKHFYKQILNGLNWGDFKDDIQ